MKTKLVYVLTCAPDKDFIEQAHMSIWSARCHNPSAYIVLIVDDATNNLFVNKRKDILNYVTEKIVVPFEDANLSPMYRSRFLKTQVRQLVDGDFLFVDSDTICCRNISEIDTFTCELGATGDNNVIFANDAYRDGTIKQVAPICDISNEEYYFSSGVLYCKDTLSVHKFFSLWHSYWLDGIEKGLNIDQPAFAMANITMGHIVTTIDDVYNCVLYTQNKCLDAAAILHISKFPFTSFLFKPKALALIRNQGITSWMSSAILRVHSTYLPFDYAIKYSTSKQRMKWIKNIAYAAKMYGKHIDMSYEEWNMRAVIEPMIKMIFRCHFYRLGAFIWVEYQKLRLARKTDLRSNVCAIE